VNCRYILGLALISYNAQTTLSLSLLHLFLASLPSSLSAQPTLYSIHLFLSSPPSSLLNLPHFIFFLAQATASLPQTLPFESRLCSAPMLSLSYRTARSPSSLTSSLTPHLQSNRAPTKNHVAAHSWSCCFSSVLVDVCTATPHRLCTRPPSCFAHPHHFFPPG